MNKRSEAGQIAVWRLHVEIINTIRATLSQVLHYERFGSHVQKKLQAALPDYHVRCVGEYNSYKIQVWVTGLPYDDTPYIAWNIPQGGSHWSSGLVDALNRADPTDSIERYEAEQAILPYLESLEDKIRVCREQAQSLISDLDIPPTAQRTGMRAEPQHWSDLSYIRRDKFPNLFPGRRL